MKQYVRRNSSGVISAAPTTAIRAFDERLFEVLLAVASSEVTMFPRPR